jgi:hypothetical protein
LVRGNSFFAPPTAGREDLESFQRCLAKSRGSTPAERRNWRDGIYEQIREVTFLQGSLSIERMCADGAGQSSEFLPVVEGTAACFQAHVSSPANVAQQNDGRIGKTRCSI